MCGNNKIWMTLLGEVALRNLKLAPKKNWWKMLGSLHFCFAEFQFICGRFQLVWIIFRLWVCMDTQLWEDKIFLENPSVCCEVSNVSRLLVKKFERFLYTTCGVAGASSVGCASSGGMGWGGGWHRASWIVFQRPHLYQVCSSFEFPSFSTGRRCDNSGEPSASEHR